MNKMMSSLFVACAVLSPMTPALAVSKVGTLAVPPNVRNLIFTPAQASWTLNVAINVSHIPSDFPKVIVYCVASSTVGGSFTVEAMGSAEQALDASGGFVGKLPVYLRREPGMDPTQATDWGCSMSFVDYKGNVANPYGPVFPPQLKGANLFIRGNLPQ